MTLELRGGVLSGGAEDSGVEDGGAVRKMWSFFWTME